MFSESRLRLELEMNNQKFFRKKYKLGRPILSYGRKQSGFLYMRGWDAKPAMRHF